MANRRGDFHDHWAERGGNGARVTFLKRIGRGEIEIDWSKILDGIPGVSSHDVVGLNIEGKNDII